VPVFLAIVLTVFLTALGERTLRMCDDVPDAVLDAVFAICTEPTAPDEAARVVNDWCRRRVEHLKVALRACLDSASSASESQRDTYQWLCTAPTDREAPPPTVPMGMRVLVDPVKVFRQSQLQMLPSALAQLTETKRRDLARSILMQFVIMERRAATP
jgi:hypothetical protein